MAETKVTPICYVIEHDDQKAKYFIELTPTSHKLCVPNKWCIRKELSRNNSLYLMLSKRDGEPSYLIFLALYMLEPNAWSTQDSIDLVMTDTVEEATKFWQQYQQQKVNAQWQQSW